MGQLQRFKQHRAQLLGRIDVEGRTGCLINAALQLRNAGGKHLPKFRQRLAVYLKAGDLHLRQYAAQGQFRPGIKLPHLPLLQKGPQCAVERIHGGGIAVQRRFGRCRVTQQRERIVLQMHRLGQFLVIIGYKQTLQIVLRGGSIQQIGGQRRIEHKPVRAQAVFQQGAHQVLYMVGHLFDVLGKQRIEQCVPVTVIAVEEQLRHDGVFLVCPAKHADRAQIRQGIHRHMVRAAPARQPFLRRFPLRHLLHGHGKIRLLFSRFRSRLQAVFVDELGKFQTQKQLVQVG